MRTDQLRQFATNPAAFRDSLVIDTDDGPRRLSEVMDDWQREDFRALDPGFMRAVGHRVEGGHSRAWLERPRGHSKTQDLAVMATWALAFAPRAIKGVAAANDREQARLMKDSIGRLLRSNPWLGRALEIYQYKVTNRHSGAELEIISADSHGAYGHLLDFLLVDDLANWRPTSQDFWTALISTAGKRRHCMTVVITNAGWLSSWTYKVREAVCGDPNWYVRSLRGSIASWISEGQLSEQRRLLPPQQYSRLWDNVWSSDSGDWISQADIEACLTLPGPVPPNTDLVDWSFACVDLGFKRHHSALVTCGMSVADQRLVVMNVQSWSPEQYGGRVDATAVAEGIFQEFFRYRLSYVLCDYHQAEVLAQQLCNRGVRIGCVNISAKESDLMARTMLRGFQDRRLALYPHEGLLRDLHKVRIVERPYGLKLDPPQDTDGHGDRAMALAMCCAAEGLPRPIAAY